MAFQFPCSNFGNGMKYCFAAHWRDSLLVAASLRAALEMFNLVILSEWTTFHFPVLSGAQSFQFALEMPHLAHPAKNPAVVSPHPWFDPFMRGIPRA